MIGQPVRRACTLQRKQVSVVPTPLLREEEATRADMVVSGLAFAMPDER
jgi:hypothetical protein